MSEFEDERGVLTQLKCVVDHYPLFPGDTISHSLAYECARRKWIVRQADGCWIPTAAGLAAYESRMDRITGKFVL